MKKLLVVDDEPGIVEVIRAYFQDNGYLVLDAGRAEAALELLAQSPDLILLDIMMPGMDGVTFCRQVRRQVSCPIIFLSARTQEASKITGLAAGGDDYITKPFGIRELYARVEAHLRREQRPRAALSVIRFGRLWVDCGGKQVGVGQATLRLTKKEYGIVELLAMHPGQVFTHERLYEAVWGYDAQGDAAAAVTEHVKRIRRKLQAQGVDRQIETVWGLGYRWLR